MRPHPNRTWPWRLSYASSQPACSKPHTQRRISKPWDEFRVDILQAVADKQELIAMLLRALWNVRTLAGPNEIRTRADPQQDFKRIRSMAATTTTVASRYARWIEKDIIIYGCLKPILANPAIWHENAADLLAVKAYPSRWSRTVRLTDRKRRPASHQPRQRSRCPVCTVSIVMFLCRLTQACLGKSSISTFEIKHNLVLAHV